MPNRRTFDHIPNCKFIVEIDGIPQGSFTEVDGLESSVEVEEYANGDDLLIRKRPGRTNCTNIIFRRGYIGTDELWMWYKQTTDGMIERKTGSVIILDDKANEIARYNFFEAWPCRYRLGSFCALDNDLLIEEIEVVVEKIERG